MSEPLFSVIIPAYNQAKFLADAIRSVLNQTYQKFEVFVVNDASSDDTDRVVKKFNDPRLKYKVHEENMRLSATRNTGIRDSKGELIALLDADDYFHPEKLRLHADYLSAHPDIGVTYNARFNLNHSSDTIRDIWRPPLKVGLKDFVLGFPFTPSDMVIRREWISKVGLFDPAMGTAEDTDFPCRLALAGCKFESVDRALNYRRYHSGRGRKNLAGRLEDVARAQEAVFLDPRCPEDVLSIKATAIKHHLMVIISLALVQEETELAQKSIRALIQLDPSVLEGAPCELMGFLLKESVADDGLDHELLLRKMMVQLPQELSWLINQYHWCIARGYLIKGIRAILWDRLGDGRNHIARACELKSEIDEAFLQNIVHQLLSYEVEFGSIAAEGMIQRLKPYIYRVGGQGKARNIQGLYYLNKSFINYRNQEYKKVLKGLFYTVINHPKLLRNRGLLSIFFRSLWIEQSKYFGGRVENRSGN